MRFVIENRGSSDLEYKFTAPFSYFAIEKKDSIILSSIDNLMFPQVITDGKIRAGSNYSAKWTVTDVNSASDDFSMTPGRYSAKVITSVGLPESVIPKKIVLDFVVTE